MFPLIPKIPSPRTPTRGRGARRGEGGQALVEFAIVAPLVILVLFFAIWFVELVQVKLKVQEAARFAAWEATAYKLHDYDKGGSANSKLYSTMSAQVLQETRKRYANMDSAVNSPTSKRIFSASWTPPMVLMINKMEEQFPGGTIINMIMGIASALFDFFSAMSYKNANVVAMALVASGKNYGGARTDRMFGSAEWGFNKNGYVSATVLTLVRNTWMNRGVGKLFMKTDPFLVLTESHSLLADSWRLNSGVDVYGDTMRPGLAKGTAFWKQVDRMYFVNKRTRAVAKGFITMFKSIMLGALAASARPDMPTGLSDSDWDQAVVTSKNYKNTTSGQVKIDQDRGSIKNYDTAPVCASCTSSGEYLKPYGETLKARGKWFMGCRTEMSLGCPSSSLQNDNPFGDYVIRD